MGRTILNQVIQDIKNQPTADVQEIRHGKWIRVTSLVDQCSECLRVKPIGRMYVWNYCPECGAKMEVDDAEIH